ncbi:hypothetical protein [Sphingomonas aerophila]|uniref:Uncharacterized protein n=1 Tax=Sphingomonas aerophila TaxID=1344948 RepID=A0A7W9BF97_9SPHN|nr:hypothetical protein [Sphingomonas aerophila]MBB5715859.1 hypothetical protein [Sphingomonas aerophila]
MGVVRVLVRTFLWIALPIATIPSAALSAESSPSPHYYGEIAGWQVFKESEYDACSAASGYEKGKLIFQWRPRENAGGLAVYFPDFKAIKDDQDYRIKVAFLKRGRVDDGWPELTAKGTSSTDGSKGLIMKFGGDVFLADMRDSQGVSFEYKGNYIGGFKLDGSGQAVAMLQRCAAEILKAHPADPFESDK